MNGPLHHFQQQQDTVDPPETMLPSFPALRQRTLDALYHDYCCGAQVDDDDDGNKMRRRLDKSPKGSVDTHIQSLVDCINRHESYATLSSCSGRIALYDPAAITTASSNNSNSNNDDTIDTLQNNSSGKGGTGGWLLVSHDVVAEDALLPFFPEKQQPKDDGQQSSSSSCLSFRLEPMLLHIAACNLQRGQQLLTVALQCGFRESGLIVTDKRVTVAIRSYSLSLTVPLSAVPGDPLRPTHDYVRALTRDANRRLQTNLERLQAFHTTIETSLFRPSDYYSQVRIAIQTSPLIADLNLHSHTAVAVPTTTGDDDANISCVDLLVFGGYGTGPDNNENENVSCKRNDRVYCLRRSVGQEQQSWNEHWHEIAITKRPTHNNSDPVLLPFRNGHISVDRVADWKACQGITAVILDDHDSSFVLLFGGRQGPEKASNDLLLFDYNANKGSGSFYQAPLVDTSSALPSPRWGHALTKLVSDPPSLQQSALPRFLLTGGRGETTTCHDSIYLLSLIEKNDERNKSKEFLYYRFLWEPVDVGSSTMSAACRRFHHTAVAMDSEHFFVFGGLFDAENLLESFTVVDTFEFDIDDEESVDAIMLTLKHHGLNEKLPTSVNVEPVQLPSDLSPRFGHAACALSIPNQSKGISTTVLLSGGVEQQRIVGDKRSGEAKAVQCLQITQVVHQKSGTQWNVRSRPISWTQDAPSVDLGVLVHHSCLVLPQPNAEQSVIDVVLVGGGVSGFAFPQLFAPSRLLTIEADAETEKSRSIELEQQTQRAVNSRQPQSSKRGHANTTTVSSRSDTSADTCDVVYVAKQNAKTIKTALEESLLLKKAFRLTQIDEAGLQNRVNDKSDLSELIAVPVYSECIDTFIRRNQGNEQQQPSWTSFVVGHGHQACPRSTGSFAQGSKPKR